MKLLQEPRLSSDERVKRPASVHGMNRGGKPVDNGPNLPAKGGGGSNPVSYADARNRCKRRHERGAKWLIRPDQNGKRGVVPDLLAGRTASAPLRRIAGRYGRLSLHVLGTRELRHHFTCCQAGSENASSWAGGRRRRSIAPMWRRNLYLRRRYHWSKVIKAASYLHPKGVGDKSMMLKG